MKAIILCAGLGTRMRPLTDAIPKCLLPVGGRPLIHHTLEALAAAGVDEVAINLHHLPGAIVRELARGYRFGVRITYSFERELLGTAGAIKPLQWWLDDEPFFVVYGDEWTTLDFGDLWKSHLISRADMTMVVHWVEDITSRNVVTLSDDLERVLGVRPKDMRMPDAVGDWVGSGIYVMHPRLVWRIIRDVTSDLEDYLGSWLWTDHAHLHAYRVDRDLTVDIGKPEGYERAKRLAAGR